MTTEPAPGKRLSPLVIALIVVGGVLLLAVVALLFLLLGRGLNPEPSAGTSPSPGIAASPSPGASPTSEAVPPPPPAQDTSTRFTFFEAPTEVLCDAGDEDNQPPKPEIMVRWESANAVEAWYSPSNKDAKDDGYMQVPLSGSQADFTDEHLFPCFDQGPTRDYTITLVGPNGEHVSRTWTVTDLSRQE